MNKLKSFLLLLISISATATANVQAAVTVSPAETRAIAKEAYLYGFPVVDNYKTMYAQVIDKKSHDYKVPLNQIANIAQVFTPDDKTIVSPNSDTPYSFLWMDLRTEPLVLSLPKTDPKRYISVQLVDMYTFNFAYLGNRATGTEGGHFLIAGPSWNGATPKGINKVIRSETEFAYAIYRTQLFGPKDIDNVKKVQAGYKVQPLSAFLGTKTPPQAALPNFPKYDEASAKDLEFFEYMNFLMQYMPTHPSEVALIDRFKKIGMEAGKPFDTNSLTPETKTALLAGIKDAQTEFNQFKKDKIDTQKINSGELFGTRESLKNNYLNRYAGARIGIYGNSREEAVYTSFFIDSDKQPLNAAKNRYVIRFAKDQLPPVNAFWSITMYDGKTQLLIDNPLNRYLINSPMLPDLKFDPDGGLTLYIQHESPGKDKESNWLPAPDGTFYTVLRMYSPKPAAIDGSWKEPAIKRIK